MKPIANDIYFQHVEDELAKGKALEKVLRG